MSKITQNEIEQNLLNGWISVSGSWAYASASTITVPSGAASLYQKGDRIKWTQTTVKYGVIVAVADTVLTIAVNNDYVVTNAAISAISYSHQANPLGYPTYFNFNTTVTITNPPTSATTLCVYSIIGTTVFFRWITSGTANASNCSQAILFTVPIAEKQNITGAVCNGKNYWTDNATFSETDNQYYWSSPTQTRFVFSTATRKPTVISSTLQYDF